MQFACKLNKKEEISLLFCDDYNKMRNSLMFIGKEPTSHVLEKNVI